MNTVLLENSTIPLTRLGVGCMGMAEFYGKTDKQQALATLNYAMEQGINLFDTADMYGRGGSELLLGEAIKNHRDKIMMSTKCGFVRPDNDINHMYINGHPDYIKNCCDESLLRLGTDYIDIYFLHRVDPKIAIEESLGALKELVHAGKIKYVGLSDTSLENITRAQKIHPITAYQGEYSLWFREAENQLIPFLNKNKIIFMPYSPLGRGFLTGKITTPKQLDENDFRRMLPRFQEENIKHNFQLLNILKRYADELQCTLAQLALAWILNKSETSIPLVGVKKQKEIAENIDALQVNLDSTIINEIDANFSEQDIVGGQYPETMNTH